MRSAELGFGDGGAHPWMEDRTLDCKLLGANERGIGEASMNAKRFSICDAKDCRGLNEFCHPSRGIGALGIP